ncbi:MAG TPA: BMP family ABC transporter substrate-binding protein, partial [Actinomycetota bacterium]|nr:BMP family ABC transporter substrate-binding protein [Actinomycetota bacterium]
MRSIRVMRFGVVVLVLALATAACGGGGQRRGGGGGTAQGPCDPAGNAAEDGVKVGIAFDVGGLGDQSFNDAAKR